MANANFRCEVKAPFDILWKTLIDEVENPHQYNPRIKGAQILERFHDGVLRTVAVPDADVRERVTFKYDKKEIISTIVGHPQLVGNILKKVTPKVRESNQWILECVLEWESTDDGVEKMIRRNIESFAMSGLDQVRIRAEAKVQGAS